MGGGYLAIIGMMRAGFPDIHWTLEETIAEGDKVAALLTMPGTHQGTFFGLPPTGKKIVVQAMNFLPADLTQEKKPKQTSQKSVKQNEC